MQHNFPRPPVRSRCELLMFEIAAHSQILPCPAQQLGKPHTFQWEHQFKMEINGHFKLKVFAVMFEFQRVCWMAYDVYEKVQWIKISLDHWKGHLFLPIKCVSNMWPLSVIPVPDLDAEHEWRLTLPNKMQPTNPNAHTYVNGTNGGLSSAKYDV